MNNNPNINHGNLPQNSSPPSTAPVDSNLPVTPEKKNVYTLTHAIFALLALIIGSLWFQLILDTQDLLAPYNAIQSTLFTIAFVLFATAFYKKSKIEFSTDSYFLLVVLLLFSLRFAVYPTDTFSSVFPLAVLVIHIIALLFMQSMGEKDTLDRIVGSTFRAVIIAPFGNFHTLFASFSAFFKLGKNTEESKTKAKKIGMEIFSVLAGIFIAFPVLAIVLILLSSDGFFSDFIGNLERFFEKISFDFNIGDYFNFITILVSLYIFGALYSSDKKRGEKPAVPQNYSFLPATVTRTVIITLLSVYVLFIVAQLEGFGCMLFGKLPDGVTYANFARSGFFELCAVACINGAVLYIMDILTIKETKRKLTNILSVILICFTFFLILTAFAKMIMYITAYGFTPKRFYTLWFMLLLTILFALALVKLRRADFRLSRYSVYVTCGMLLVLFFVDFEGMSNGLNSAYFPQELNAVNYVSHYIAL